MEYIVDIDSGERESGKPINDYIIKLNRILYDVSHFKLISGRIPMNQTTIHNYNNTFFLNSQSYSILNGDYATVNDLISSFPTIPNITVTLDFDKIKFENTDTDDFSLDFTTGGLGPVLGFDFKVYESVNGILIAPNKLFLDDPTSLLIRVSSGANIMSKEVYKDGFDHSYTGRVILKQRRDEIVYYSGNSDPIEYKFHEGNWASLDHMRIQFFYSIGSRLVPYDFGGKNHALKCIIKGNTDKLNTFKGKRVDIPPPKPIELESISESKEKTKIDTIYIISGFALVVTLMFLLFKQPPRTLAPRGP